MLTHADLHRPEIIKPMLPARAKLKLLILEADEETMDRIIEAIQMVCGADSEIRQ